MMYPTLVWFRNDLRLEDNPAFCAAVEQKGPILPLYIHAPDEEGEWKPGEASNWWLHHSLYALHEELSKLGLRLIVQQGESLDILTRLAKKTKAAAIFWNRRYEPTLVARDAYVKSCLQELDVFVESFNASLLFEPWEIKNRQDKPFKVFTPFWKHYLSIMAPPMPLARPQTVLAPSSWPPSLSIGDLELQPFYDWTGGLQENWKPGARHAKHQLERFINETILHYDEKRNRPDTVGTSRLSPYLHFGDIGPRQVFHAVQERLQEENNDAFAKNAWAFLRELGWREFAYHLLFHFPYTADSPLREEFEAFPWQANPQGMEAWRKGLTGYPIVDAGMRELWETGWMHNRVRMIVASFLVKDQLLPWREGAKWFWNTLVDADLANNTLGWQWTAGCGADAAPYFRIFNPVLQGEKFDPQGHYVRKWVPELAGLPNKLLHKPWEASPTALAEAGIELGETYPRPIVDHKEARADALRAYDTIKKKKAN
ncbi:deoxyribodipyrimidine photo-lyase [bacterium]|nr:deoxyribodipyrimidine photo-lyase [bacterium]